MKAQEGTPRSSVSDASPAMCSGTVTESTIEYSRVGKGIGLMGRMHTQVRERSECGTLRGVVVVVWRESTPYMIEDGWGMGWGGKETKDWTATDNGLGWGKDGEWATFCAAGGAGSGAGGGAGLLVLVVVVVAGTGARSYGPSSG